MSILNLFDFKPKMKDFAAEFLKALARNGLSGWTFDADPGSLRHSTGGVINLSNMHLEYVNARRADRPAFLSKYVELAKAQSLQVPGRWPEASDAIRAVVRSRYDYAVVEIDHRGGDPWPVTVSWPFVSDLCVRLVHDFGPHVSHVKQETMISWAQHDDVVKHRAVENLNRSSKPTWQSLGAGVYRLISEEHAESFLLVDDIFDQLSFKDSLVAIPCNRGILLAADGKSKSALIAMIDEAGRCLRNRPWPLTGTLCTRAQGQWREFQPGNELELRAHDLQILNLAGIYNDQKAALDAYHQKTGRDVFVASYGVVERDDRLQSWCAWTEDVPTLLARTDVIAFRPLDDTSETLLLNWDDVVRCVGPLLQPTSEDPARFFVDSFPNNDDWDLMKADMARRGNGM